MLRRDFIKLCGGSLALLYLGARPGRVHGAEVCLIEPGTTNLAFDVHSAQYEVNAESQTLLRRTSDGQIAWRIGGEGSAAAEFRQPNAIAVSPAGKVYVVDVRNHRVQVFSQGGQFLFAFSQFGAGPAQLDNPRGDLVFFDNAIYLCDSGNHRIQVFTEQGALRASLAENELSYPVGLALAGDGTLFVADQQQAAIKVLDARGHLQHAFDCGGELVCPCSLVLTADETLLIADWGRGLVFECTRDGTLRDARAPATGDGARYIPLRLVTRGEEIFVLGYPAAALRTADAAARAATGG